MIVLEDNIQFAPITIKRLSYDNAVLYCQFLNYDGYNDWRMPTHDEYVTAMRRYDCYNLLIWYQDRDDMQAPYGHNVELEVIPVRTV